MARVYAVFYSGTLTAAGTDCDLLALKPAANKPIRLLGLRLGQSSEVQDAQEENLRVSIIRMTATITDGSGGSAVTPTPIDENDAAAGFTCRANDTTIATTSGSSTTLEEIGWNERNTPAEFWWPDDPVGPRAQNAGGLIIRNQTTVGDDLTIQLTAWVREY